MAVDLNFNVFRVVVNGFYHLGFFCGKFYTVFDQMIVQLPGLVIIYSDE